jgi:hypothetical protein
LSLRHLQRLVSGKGAPRRLRPATARLLERIFEEEVEELLSVADNVHRIRSEQDTGPANPYALRVAISVVVKDGSVLIVSPRDSSVARPSSWQFPAGVVKPGADSAAVAVAETLTETGVNCIHLRFLGTRVHPATGVALRLSLV